MTPVYIANFKDSQKVTVDGDVEVEVSNLAELDNLPVVATNLKQEEFTHYHPVIQSDHAYIHQGLAFDYPCTFSLGSQATKACILKPPAASVGYIHWRPTVVSSVSSPIRWELYETPTYTGGTELEGVVNLNRNSLLNNGMKLFDGAVTVTDNGLRITIATVGTGGNVQTRTGGGGGSENEIVFNPAKEYLLLFTNLTTTATVVTATLFWYEEETG
jgi:hypothetical protein